MPIIFSIFLDQGKIEERRNYQYIFLSNLIHQKMNAIDGHFFIWNMWNWVTVIGA
jgi:hypothetical protein